MYLSLNICANKIHGVHILGELESGGQHTREATRATLEVGSDGELFLRFESQFDTQIAEELFHCGALLAYIP